MALAKKDADVQDETQDDQSKTRPDEQSKQAAEKSKPDFVSATNIGKQDHRQPSTGIWVGAGQTKDLKNDGWLRAQVKAKIFKLD